MNAYDIMHEWDRAAGNDPRSDEELDRDIPPKLAEYGYDYEEWKAQLEAGNVKAIKTGMKIWGLPIAPLGPFEMDKEIETMDRPYWPGADS